MPPCAAKPQYGQNVYTTNCKCPPNLPYESPYFSIDGFYLKVCGDAPFAPGIVSRGGVTPPLTGYPKQTVVEGPPLNVPSRANQKANTFSKIFDPKTRKILVLLIAGFLIFLAATSYD